MKSRLQDKTTVLKELGIDTPDIDLVLAELINEMESDSQSIQETSVSLGSIKADSTNQGGAKILVTKILDGATSPGTINGVRIPANLKYKGKSSELCGNETFNFRVTADSFQDRLSPGNEEISWGGCPHANPHGLKNGGSGHIGTFRPLHASTDQFLSNAEFESFTSNAPNGWDVVSGIPGTHIFQLQNGAAQGSSALRFKGDGILTNIEIKQDIDPSSVIANKLYCVTVKMHKPITFGGNSPKMIVRFEGIGYTASATEQINTSSISFHGYKLYNFFVLMPAVIPNDFKLVIRLDGTSQVAAAADNYFIDDLSMGTVTFGGGIGAVAVRDSGPFVRGDGFEVSSTATEGVFQEFFRRILGTQLPSSATPTISDTLVTGPII